MVQFLRFVTIQESLSFSFLYVNINFQIHLFLSCDLYYHIYYTPQAYLDLAIS